MTGKIRLYLVLSLFIALSACSDGKSAAPSNPAPPTIPTQPINSTQPAPVAPDTPVIPQPSTPTPVVADPPPVDDSPATTPPPENPPVATPPETIPPVNPVPVDPVPVDPVPVDPVPVDPVPVDPVPVDPVPVDPVPVDFPSVNNPPIDEPVDDEPAVIATPGDPFNALLESAPASSPADGMPSVPANLRVDLLSNNWVELNWASSTDDGSIVEYRLYRDDGVTYSIRGDQSDSVEGTNDEISKFWRTTSFIDCNYTRFGNHLHNCFANQPTTGGEYNYQVSAIDNDGNESAKSDPLRVKLYENAGAPVELYDDIYLEPNDQFPFTTDFSSTANFIGGFQLVFEDEFTGDRLDPNKWNTALTWGHNEAINGEKQYFIDTLANPDFGYDPFVFNGSTLTIAAIQTPPTLSEAALGQPFLSGALSSHDKFGFTYGYVEGRMKVGGVSGQLSSFYLFRRWVAEHAPEIDIIEYLGENPFGDEDAFQTYHFRDTVHGVTRSSPTMSVKAASGRYSDNFHVYGVLWEPGLVVWYIDGQEVLRLSGDQIGRQQMNIVAYLVTGSDWAPTPELSAGNFPLKLEIDYIKVYQRDPFIR